MGGIIDGIKDAFSSIVSKVSDAITTALSNFVGTICYYIVIALCKIVNMLYNFFAVFAGIRTVQYDGSDQFLINVFFGNKSVTNIYWGMALIGMVFIFVFTIIAVIKKAMDLNNKLQTTLGSIFLGTAKSFLTILLLSAVMSAVLNITNVLVDRVSFLFDNADSIDKKTEMTFTDEQYATMARVFNTIGNYSLNPSYNSRFNLNSCYNAIRPDLLQLQEEGVFDFYYDDENERCWQSTLQRLIMIYDPRYEVKMDYYSEVSETVLQIMEEMKAHADFYPISYIKREYVTAETVPLDRVIFLMGTMQATRSPRFSESPSLTDPARAPFFYGESGKSIYNLDDVSEVFNIGITGISYLMIGLMAWFTIKNLVVCIFNCISRIINLLGLYIIAPPMVAITPIDGGEKFKQWMTAATVQMFGIFGSIIPMRLVIIFIPIILDGKLVIFGDSILMDIFAKAILILGGIEAANRFSSIFTGILANSAGMEAVRAGDMSNFAGRAMALATGAVKGAAGVAADVTGVGAVGKAVGKSVSGAYKSMSEKGGILVGSVRSYRDNKAESAKKKEETALKSRQDAVNMKKLEEDEKKYGLNKPLPPNVGKKK